MQIWDLYNYFLYCFAEKFTFYRCSRANAFQLYSKTSFIRLAPPLFICRFLCLAISARWKPLESLLGMDPNLMGPDTEIGSGSFAALGPNLGSGTVDPTECCQFLIILLGERGRVEATQEQAWGVSSPSSPTAPASNSTWLSCLSTGQLGQMWSEAGRLWMRGQKKFPPHPHFHTAPPPPPTVKHLAWSLLQWMACRVLNGRSSQSSTALTRLLVWSLCQ